MNTSDIIVPIILCGGSGSRLWPLSRRSLPKQFMPIFEDKSLLQATFERAISLAKNSIFTVGNEEHRFLLRDTAESTNISTNIIVRHILEPTGRNTAAAMAAAALNAKPGHILLFLPADHYIPDTKQFTETIKKGITAATSGSIVTFGIKPAYPHTGYGYIHTNHSVNTIKSVKFFVEKPNLEDAQNYITSEDYFWNTGIFLVRADTLLNSLSQYTPDIFKSVTLAVNNQRLDGDFIHLDATAFSNTRSESIDYAVLEHYKNIAMVTFDGKWSDVGSWNAVAELTEADNHQNRIHGNGRIYNSKSTYIHAPHRPVIAIGTENMLIIDTADALLVANKNYAEKVKDIVADLQKSNIPQATEHRHVSRPWGGYNTIDEGHRFKVKRITVSPGASLSLQLHHHRAEHWIVVKGTAQVTHEDKTFLLSENESTFIPVGSKHRLTNPGTIALEMIEVQSGSYLEEDDIERFDDKYGR